MTKLILKKKINNNNKYFTFFKICKAINRVPNYQQNMTITIKKSSIQTYQ